MENDNSRLVFSTETGRMCMDCKRPLKKCACKGKHTHKGNGLNSDGVIRIRRETKGRGGKTVTTICVLPAGVLNLSPADGVP